MQRTPWDGQTISSASQLGGATRGNQAEEGERPSHPVVRSVSMVMPAYNEAANIRRAVERALDALEAAGLDHELIVVNDGSRDGTGEILRQLAERHPRLHLVEHFPNRGYGGALRAGFAAATREWVFQTDSDNQFDYTELCRLVELAPGRDVIVGYRRPRRDPLMRRLNGWGWNWLIRMLFGYVVRDIDCAFRLIRRSALESVCLTSNGAMVSAELLASLKARGYSFAEVRVTHLPRDGGQPTGANLRVILRAFRDVVLFRLRMRRQLRLTIAPASVPPASVSPPAPVPQPPARPVMPTSRPAACRGRVPMIGS